VADNVTGFEGYGMGAYAFFNRERAIYSSEAFQAPKRPGVQFHDIFTVFLSTSGSGGINSVINGTGGPANIASPDRPVDVATYP
jgi:hypothetical protein